MVRLINYRSQINRLAKKVEKNREKLKSETALILHYKSLALEYNDLLKLAKYGEKLINQQNQENKTLKKQLKQYE